jgi:hypothetical protein
MTSAQLTVAPHPLGDDGPTGDAGAPPRPPTVGEMADELLPLVGVVFQAGPPAYAIVAFGAVIALLACAPLMILAAVVIVAFVATAVAAAVVGVVVGLPWLLLRDLDVHLPHRARDAQQTAGRVVDGGSTVLVGERRLRHSVSSPR